MWIDTWSSLSDSEFVLIADQWMVDRVGWTGYKALVVASDIERERRGFPLPPPLIDLSQAKVESSGDWSDPIARANAADWLYWDLNRRVARGEASEAETHNWYRAEAERARAWRLQSPDEWDRYGRRKRV